MNGEAGSCLGATDCEVSPSPPGKTGKEGCVLWVQRQSCLLASGVRLGETPFECEGVGSGRQQSPWRDGASGQVPMSLNCPPSWVDSEHTVVFHYKWALHLGTGVVITLILVSACPLG